MASKWLKRLGFAAVIAGAVAGGVLHFDVADAIGTAKGAPAVPVAAVETPPAVLELAQVEVTTVEPNDLVERLRVSGELRPVNRAVVKAKVAGTVLEVAAREGQEVKSGDVLIRFETENLESTLVQHDSNLDAARAQLTLAEQTLAKTEELARRGFATKASLEKAQSDVAAAKANVEGLSAQTDTAKSALDDAELVAPFDGVVASRSVEPGEPASANAELLTIVDTSVLEAEVLVSTRDVSRLKVGDAAQLQVDGLDGAPIAGTVDRINPVANEGSRFVPVHIRLENTDGRLWGGMFATGSILLREGEDVLAVPQTALRSDEDGRYVLKFEDGRLVRQPVEVGPTWNDERLVQINEGIAAGDTVLSAPLPELQAGTPVIISGAS